MRPFHRLSIAAAVFLSCTLPLFADDKHSQDESLFSAGAYAETVAYLASDALEGRGTGQEGIDKAAEFIAGVFEELGVEPAGDDGTYYQEFALRLKSRIGDGTRVAIGTKGRKTRRALRLNKSFVPLPYSESGTFKGGVVFVGYGIVDDDLDYDDYDGIDAADKVLLMFRQAPEFADFGNRNKSFRRKASRAIARDAAAILFVNPVDDEDADTLYKFETSHGGARMAPRSNGIPMLHLTRKTANKMLKAAGLPDLASLQAEIEDTEAPASRPLKGVSAKGLVNIEKIESPVRNVAGLIPGAGAQSDEIIVLGAHYDHLGVRNKNSDDFDPDKDISNGADDNASGTAMVMTLAKVFTQGPKPNRSILLLTFTGEELGLLGSRHFVKNPTVDLSKCIAMFNFDMVGRLKDDKLEIGGMRTGGLEDEVRRLTEPYGLVVQDGGGGRGPSDHSSFYGADIPVLFFFTGIHKQYHRPTDDSPLINSEGAMRIAKLAADVIDEIDESAEPPRFVADRRNARLARQNDKEKQAAGPADGQRRVRLGIVPDPDAEGTGVTAARISDDSVADRAGLKEGDRILKIGDAKVSSVEDLIEALGRFKNGDATTLLVKRKKKTVELDVRFGEREKAVAARGPTAVAAKVAGVLHRCAQAWGSDAECVFTVEKGDESIRITVTGADLLAMLEPDEEGSPAATVLQFLADNFQDGAGTFTIKTEAKSSAEGMDVGFSLQFAFEIPSEISADAGKARADRRAAHAKDGKGKKKAKAARKAKAKKKSKRKARDKDANPHAADGDAETTVSMPPVRLGIMPGYGEPEGEGYEISGVVEGGPAQKAGMKDSDRIHKIGKHVIRDIYGYMDALREFKPGDVIPVVVLRDGKKVTLKIKCAPAKSQEAA